MSESDKLFEENNYIRDYEVLDGVYSYYNIEDNQMISFNNNTKSMELSKLTGEKVMDNDLFGIVNLNKDLIQVIIMKVEELGWTNQK